MPITSPDKEYDIWDQWLGQLGKRTEEARKRDKEKNRERMDQLDTAIERVQARPEYGRIEPEARPEWQPPETNKWDRIGRTVGRALGGNPIGALDEAFNYKKRKYGESAMQHESALDHWLARTKATSEINRNRATSQAASDKSEADFLGLHKDMPSALDVEKQTVDIMDTASKSRGQLGDEARARTEAEQASTTATAAAELDKLKAESEIAYKKSLTDEAKSRADRNRALTERTKTLTPLERERLITETHALSERLKGEKAEGVFTRKISSLIEDRWAFESEMNEQLAKALELRTQSAKSGDREAEAKAIELVRTIQKAQTEGMSDNDGQLKSIVEVLRTLDEAKPWFGSGSSRDPLDLMVIKATEDQDKI